MQLICLVSFIVLLPALVLPEVIQPQIAAQEPFVKCTKFFAKPGGIVTFPKINSQGNQYKQICQKYNDQYEFATLYNTDYRIPVYSAYLYQGIQSTKKKKKKKERKEKKKPILWKIEPQLEDISNFKEHSNMASISSVGKKSHKNKTPRKNQAENADYRLSGYDKGHLFPVCHTARQNLKEATFTLTNAAPQDPSLNSGKWYSQVEKVTKDFIHENCNLNFAYVVTGVVPGTQKLKDRVTIPSFFWSAYCCLDDDMQPTYSAGFISANNEVDFIPKITVETLDHNLSEHYNTVFSVFNNRCRRQNTQNEAVLPTSMPKLSMIQDRIVNNSSLSQDQVGSRVQVWRNTNSILDHKSDL